MLGRSDLDKGSSGESRAQGCGILTDRQTEPSGGTVQVPES